MKHHKHNDEAELRMSQLSWASVTYKDKQWNDFQDIGNMT